MSWFSLEQHRPALLADFAFYGAAVVLPAFLTLAWLPAHYTGQALACTGVGIVGWTLAEYALHRFVLHGVQPLKRWHALHHARPRALIATPTVFTAALFTLLVAAPAWWLLAPWRASALVLGVMLGYLHYIVTHHALHREHGGGTWLRRHKRWHALHHRIGSRACYGVSTPLWDYVFRSARPAVRRPSSSSVRGRTDGSV